MAMSVQDVSASFCALIRVVAILASMSCGIGFNSGICLLIFYHLLGARSLEIYESWMSEV